MKIIQKILENLEDVHREFKEFRQLSALNILRIVLYIALGAFYRAILDSNLLSLGNNDLSTKVHFFRSQLRDLKFTQFYGHSYVMIGFVESTEDRTTAI